MLKIHANGDGVTVSSDSFTKFPTEIQLDKTLSDRAKLLYLEIRRYARDEGRCWACQATLADDLGWSVRKVQMAADELLKAGWITRIRTGRSNRYIPQTRRVLRVCSATPCVSDPQPVAYEVDAVKKMNGSSRRSGDDVESAREPETTTTTTDISPDASELLAIYDDAFGPAPTRPEDVQAAQDLAPNVDLVDFEAVCEWAATDRYSLRNWGKSFAHAARCYRSTAPMYKSMPDVACQTCGWEHRLTSDQEREYRRDGEYTCAECQDGAAEVERQIAAEQAQASAEREPWHETRPLVTCLMNHCDQQFYADEGERFCPHCRNRLRDRVNDSDADAIPFEMAA